MNVKLKKDAGYNNLLEKYGEDWVLCGCNPGLIDNFVLIRPVDSNSLHPVLARAVEGIEGVYEE